MNANALKTQMAREIEDFIDDKLADFAKETGLISKVVAKTCFTPMYNEDSGLIRSDDIRASFATCCHIDIASGSAGEFQLYLIDGTTVTDDKVAHDL